MRIAVILGTPPEKIKIAPVIREYQSRGLYHFVPHTGQPLFIRNGPGILRAA